MKSKSLPCIADSVKFINACAGIRLVRARNRLAITPTHIDFLVTNEYYGSTLMNYALSAFWRKIGSHTRAVRIQDHEVVMFYEWNFAPPAGKMRLMWLKDGRTVVRLSNQVTERRTGNRAEPQADRRS